MAAERHLCFKSNQSKSREVKLLQLSTLDCGYVDAIVLRRVMEERPLIRAKIENHIGRFVKSILVDRATYTLVSSRQIVSWCLAPRDIVHDGDIHLTDVAFYSVEKVIGIVALRILGQDKGKEIDGWPLHVNRSL